MITTGPEGVGRSSEWGYHASRFDAAVDRLTSVGYRVDLRATGAELGDGRRIPALYDVIGNGNASLVRDDDVTGLEFLASDVEVASRRACLAGERRPVEHIEPPSLTGPLAVGSGPRDHPQMATTYDLRERGYREAEFTLRGRASRRLVVDGGPFRRLSDGHPFATRLLARVPVDPTAFRGTVVAEWLNVTSIANVDQLWLECGEDLMSQGFAYVGVSVQRVGVHGPRLGLREWSPERYRTLDLTDGGAVHDDSLSFDVFAQAARGVRDHGLPGVLPARRVECLIASGSSQSCKMLTTFHNGFESRVDPYDAYLLALGLGDPVRERADTHVLKLNSETDVLLREAAARQPDTETLCTWEIAGASHISFQMERARSEIVARGDLPRIPVELATDPPFAKIPWGRCAVAGLGHLESSVTGAGTVPRGIPLETVSISARSSALRRDEDGNSLGGIRLPSQRVPVASNRGLNRGPGRADLWGAHLPFSNERIRELYPTVGRFVELTTEAEADCVRAGFAVARSAHDMSEADTRIVRIALDGT